MKTLLLTNDDGYLAPGLQRLKEILSTKYDIYVVAPDRERSAISMSLSINHPLRMKQMAEKEYMVDGTPSDCITIALDKVLPARPDFVVSGMNMGENLAEDVFYSGTVAAAFSAHIYGVPALAVSLTGNKEKRIHAGADFNFREGANVTVDILEKILPLQNLDIVYNLNIPNPFSGHVAVTAVGRKQYRPSIVERVDPRGAAYYWIGTGSPKDTGMENSDLQAVEAGHASLSILKYDLNCFDQMKKLTEVMDDRARKFPKS
ncbi:MAG: 5'/3'-nucleotidase SurE [bacterium]|nr:5'/3'-nucleotidase SurE [bacterium]